MQVPYFGQEYISSAAESFLMCGISGHRMSGIPFLDDVMYQANHSCLSISLHVI